MWSMNIYGPVLTIYGNKDAQHIYVEIQMQEKCIYIYPCIQPVQFSSTFTVECFSLDCLWNKIHYSEPVGMRQFIYISLHDSVTIIDYLNLMYKERLEMYANVMMGFLDTISHIICGPQGNE